MAQLLAGTLRLDDHVNSDAYLQDPYVIWAQLRLEDPIQWSDKLSAWVVTSYSLVKQAGKHPCIGGGSDRASNHVAKFSIDERKQLEPLVGYYSRFMSYMNPPEHSTQRAFLSEAFTRRVVENLRPAIQSRVEELIDSNLARGRMDILIDFALPLSSSIILEMLGIQSADRQTFIEWIANAFAFLGSDQSDFKIAKRAMDSYLEMSLYLESVINNHRLNPRDDLVGALLNLQRHEPNLTDARLLPLLVTVIHGGWETTTTLIVNGTLNLLSHPKQWNRLRDAPSVLKSAIGEILRFDGPFKGVTRAAQLSFEWEGRRIQSGDSIILMLAAANRD
ncbi:MAG: cytochrome P450, partial [Planctomycetota bacterium]|nr:cytochrome P450 [Planctomycetota bacterium]